MTNSIVDSIGILRAQIAPLEKQLKALEAELKAQGPGRYEGMAYDATVSVYSVARLDLTSVRAKLTPQFIRAHTYDSNVVKIVVSARLPAVVA